MGENIDILTTDHIYHFVRYGNLFLPVLIPSLGHPVSNRCYSPLTAYLYIAPSTSISSITFVAYPPVFVVSHCRNLCNDMVQRRMDSKERRKGLPYPLLCYCHLVSLKIATRSNCSIINDLIQMS